MSDPAIDPLALEAYQLRLPLFEGPLDVLLRLIERDKLTITDISLVTVTDQFLAHLSQLPERTPALVAEFTAVGARLVLLKTRSLLPRPAAVLDDPAPDDLTQQLAEYRALKLATQQFAAWDRQAHGGYDRGSAIIAPAAPAARLAPQPPQALARALRRRLTTILPAPQQLATRRLVSLRAMSERLLALLPGGATRFAIVRAGCADREEVMVSFLALLVLIRRRVVDADQPTLFGDIAITRQIAREAPTAAMTAPAAREPSA